MSEEQVDENDEIIVNQSDDTFDMELPDIPMPSEEEVDVNIEDKIPVGFKFAFVGSGQGGSRIAETFNKLGYKRVCAVNTAAQDLATCTISNKLKIGNESGAGKDREVARAVIKEQREDILDLFRRSFAGDCDRVIVCAGAGGGTGSGTTAELIEIAREYQASIKATSDKVGVFLALPKITEGKKCAANAYKTLKEVLQYVDKGIVSPLVIIDNEKINKLYPRLSINQFWTTSNGSICTLFNLFNNIITKNSSYSTFDNKDYKTVLDSGIMVFGATQVTKWADGTDISKAMRDNLQKNILSGGVKLSTGNVAAAVVIGDEDSLDNIPQEYLDQAFEQLTRTLKTNSTVHQGIYKGNKSGLSIFTAIGGLGKPEDKLDELARVGDIERDI
jgi:cell division GTPase FtsZ